MRLLHYHASPRGKQSESLKVATAFLEAATAADPGLEVEEIDLFDGTLPQFGTLAAGAKMAVFAGTQPSAEQSAEWGAARAVFERFQTGDAYLFSVPMWNSGVPYVLKQWIDLITQPGWVFGFDPAAGYSGLVQGKKAAVVYTSGVYSPGVPLPFGIDFHSAFFSDWLRFAGFASENVTEIRLQPTILTTSLDEAREQAIVSAREAGQAF